MKYSGGNIPDVVINNEVYHDYGQAWVAEQGAIRSSSYYLTAKETHSFVKEVVTHNKVRVFEHLLHHGFNLHLGDLIYLACQHGCLEMTNLIMDAGKVGPEALLLHIACSFHLLIREIILIDEKPYHYDLMGSYELLQLQLSRVSST